MFKTCLDAVKSSIGITTDVENLCVCINRYQNAKESEEQNSIYLISPLFKTIKYKITNFLKD